MKRLCADASAKRGLRGAAIAALAAGMLAGCAASGDPGTGAVDTGTYPNLNVPPRVAAEQLTAGEQAQDTAELRASQRAAVSSASAPVPNDQAELQRLGRNHAEETLAEIEKRKKKPK